MLPAVYAALPSSSSTRNESQSLAARRPVHRRTRARYYIVALRDLLPPSLTPKNWETFNLRPYITEPLLCFRCQRFWHHQTTCSQPQVCCMYSGWQEIHKCLERYRDKEDFFTCANCSLLHHVWNPLCSARLCRVNCGREQQVEWVRD